MTEELSASRRKMIASLRTPRRRRETGFFAAEGTKCILELLPYYDCELIAASQEWIDSHTPLGCSAPVFRASRADLERISSLSTAPDALAVFRIPEVSFDPRSIGHGLTLALDGVQDPGNLGTIIRCCDWFGVKTLLCSRGTVDQYNPKVVQSTMGALSRVSIHYVDLPRALSGVKVPVYGTFLDGENIYSAPLSNDAIIVMGNEGNGISSEVEKVITDRLFIPPYPPGTPHVESLNVSMATAITLSSFRQSNR